MQKDGMFSTILKTVFVILLVLAPILFIAIKPKSASQKAGLAGNVTMWGTVPSDMLDPGMSALGTSLPDLKIAYRYIKPSDFDRVFVDALASGAGPDLVVLSSDEVMHQRTRLYTVPLEAYPIPQFEANFSDAAKPFLLPWGVTAFPFMVDPLVMYYNKDLLTSAYLTGPAKTWQELEEQIPILTIKDDVTQNIIQSTLAMGTYNNVNHADDILSLLIFQSGGTFVTYKPEGEFASTLLSAGGGDVTNQPAKEALAYYLSYADTSSPRYSWSTGRPNSLDAFVASDTVYYFGLASEYKTIAERNPNLNFELAPVPQLKNARIKSTSGKVYGVAITRTSQQQQLAYSAASAFVYSDSSKAITDNLGTAPVLRSLLATLPKDTRSATIYQSAIIAKAWWKPSDEFASNMFKDMVNKVQAGLFDVNEAVSNADTMLAAELVKIQPPKGFLPEEDTPQS